MEEAFLAGGFRGVETRLVSAPVRLASGAECLRWREESSGTLQEMLAGMDEDKREEIWKEIGLEFKKFEGVNGFESPCELIVAVGMKEK